MYQLDENGRPVLGGQYLADVGRGVVQDSRVAGFTPGQNTVLARNGDGQLATNSMRVGGGSAARQQPMNLGLGAQTAAASAPATGTTTAGAIGGATAGAASPAAASTGGGLVQDVNLSQYNQNPYLAQMGTVLTNRVNDNLQRNILPSIRGGAIAAGGVGGSRQGVIEANALNDANRQISDSLTGINFQDFTNQMNRNLAQYGQNQAFYNANRGMDLQQTALGANLFQQGNQGWLSQGQGLSGLGATQQQAPWQVINNANAGLGQWSGYGTTTSANQGGGAQGALGGALAGGQLGSLWGGAGTSGVTAPVGGYTSGASYNFAPQGGLGLKWP